MCRAIDIARAEKVAALLDGTSFEGEANAALARIRDMLAASGLSLGETILAGIRAKTLSPRADEIVDEAGRRRWADEQARQAGFA